MVFQNFDLKFHRDPLFSIRIDLKLVLLFFADPPSSLTPLISFVTFSKNSQIPEFLSPKIWYLPEYRPALRLVINRFIL